MKIRPGLEFLFPLLMSLSLFAHPASALEDEDPVAYGDSFCVQGECGYMRSDGEVLIPPEFTVVWFLEDIGMVAPVYGNRWGTVNPKGEWVIPPLGQFFDFSDGAAWAERDNKWGYIDTQGNWVIEPRFEGLCMPFRKDGLLAAKDKGKWGYINSRGEWIIQPRFEPYLPPSPRYLIDDRTHPDCLGEFGSEGLAAVSFGGKRGYIDRSGAWVAPPVFTEALPFANGLAAVKFNGLWGYIDANGEEAFSPRFEEAKSFNDKGVALAGLRLLGLINRKGEWVVEPRFEQIRSTQESAVILVGYANKWGAIDYKGNWLFEQRFEWIDDFIDGLAVAKYNGKHGFINTAGGWVIGPRFQKLEPFSEGLALAQVDGKWGFIDRQGMWVMAPRFEDASSFRASGLAGVKIEGQKWGLINKDGEWVVSPQFETNPVQGMKGGKKIGVVQGYTAATSHGWRAYNTRGELLLYEDPHSDSLVLKNGRHEIVWTKGAAPTKK